MGEWYIVRDEGQVGEWYIVRDEGQVHGEWYLCMMRGRRGSGLLYVVL